MRVRFRVLTSGHTDQIKGHTTGTLLHIPQLDKMPTQPRQQFTVMRNIRLIVDPDFLQTAVSDVRMDDK